MHSQEEFLDGRRLYGDDFNLQEVAEWLEDEKEAYANLYAKDKSKYRYSFHALNLKHGFSHLPPRLFFNILGFGAAYGDELKPILARTKRITIVETSEVFLETHIKPVPITYTTPEVDCSLPFSDETYDLVTCFGVLHHLPRVSKVMREFYRCLVPGGYCLVREPTISMGDWRKPRPGLTPRERGIPLRIFRHIVSTIGFAILSEERCVFSLIGKFSNLSGRHLYNLSSIIPIDEVLCAGFRWNEVYHPRRIIEKIGPTSVFYVLPKPER